MDSAVIAALVAGVVTLAGVLANLYIARQTRRATYLQPHLESLASDASKSSELLKGFITEAERVRICCWSLLGHLDYLNHGQTKDIYEPLKTDTEMFREAIGVFIHGTRAYEESWAPVKGEIPQGIERYIRSARHNSLHLVRLAEMHIQRLVDELEKNREGAKVKELISRSEESLHRLLTALDRLISLVKSVNERHMNNRLKA